MKKKLHQSAAAALPVLICLLLGASGALASNNSLMFLHHRDYDPLLERFTAPDQANPAGNIGHNRYAYSNNNPINNSDPSGLEAGESALTKGLYGFDRPAAKQFLATHRFVQDGKVTFNGDEELIDLMYRLVTLTTDRLDPELAVAQKIYQLNPPGVDFRDMDDMDHKKKEQQADKLEQQLDRTQLEADVKQAQDLKFELDTRARAVAYNFSDDRKTAWEQQHIPRGISNHVEDIYYMDTANFWVASSVNQPMQLARTYSVTWGDTVVGLASFGLFAKFGMSKGLMSWKAVPVGVGIGEADYKLHRYVDGNWLRYLDQPGYYDARWSPAARAPVPWGSGNYPPGRTQTGSAGCPLKVTGQAAGLC